MGRTKRDKAKEKEFHRPTTDLDLLLIKDRVLELWYGGGYTIEEIASTVGTFKNNVRHIIGDEEEARKIPAILPKVVERKPNMYTVIDHSTKKLYYDITEYLLDTPGIYGDPSKGR